MFSHLVAMREAAFVAEAAVAVIAEVVAETAATAFGMFVMCVGCLIASLFVCSFVHSSRYKHFDHEPREGG